MARKGRSIGSVVGVVDSSGPSGPDYVLGMTKTPSLALRVGVMQLRDDLFSVLNLGWEYSRRAWQLFAPERHEKLTSDEIGSTGQDFDQLAHDLCRLGHDKPARLAFSTAFVLNGLVSGTIEFDRELIAKTSQIVSVLAEMPLELEATSQVTAEEPAEIVELQDQWGLVMYVEDHSSSPLPRPHFRQVSNQAEVAVFPAELAAITDELVSTSETLLNRVIQDGEFPFTATLGRIHHLSSTIRDLISPTGQVVLPVESAIVERSAVPIIESTEARPVEESIQDHSNLPLEYAAITTSLVSSPLHQVLVIDESPFFRMLLATAIEAAGYGVVTVTGLAEARAQFDLNSIGLVICSANASIEMQDWLRDNISEGHFCLISLSNEAVAATDDAASIRQIRRTDLSGLLNAVTARLGPAIQKIKLSA